MSYRKAFAIFVVTGVLTAQFLATLPPRAYRGWYWPFLDYPMYSDAHYAGDAIARHRLLATPCAGDTGAHILGAGDLGVVDWRLIYLTRNAAAQESADRHLRTFIGPDGTAEAREEIKMKVQAGQAEAYCRLALQEQALMVGEPVPRDLEILWRDLWVVDLASDQAGRP